MERNKPPNISDMSKIIAQQIKGSFRTRQPTDSMEDIENYSGSPHEFNTLDKISLSSQQKIILDNLWVAHKKNDRKHIIACLNDLAKMFSKSNPDKQILIYVILDGKINGIFSSWAEVAFNTKGHKNAKFKKYPSFKEALRDANMYLVKPFHISPKLHHHIKPDDTASSSNVNSKDLEAENAQQMLRLDALEDHIQTLEESIQSLNMERESLIKKNQILEKKVTDLMAGASMKSALQDQDPISTLLSKVKEIAEKQEAMTDLLQSHDNKPSLGYDQWLESFADEVLRPLVREETSKVIDSGTPSFAIPTAYQKAYFQKEEDKDEKMTEQNDKKTVEQDSSTTNEDLVEVGPH
ncbi:hypothetical protein RJ639_025966 [Escallonia herrerae]|uniref:Ribonuclease H1 N-terminal domain-containing protein n=1 Tax=Escallonia herrerae TaxID=1293975 RepID=A0AA88UX74_9ASTE|nr:hypothetical protein RJ639_025966 [Escallonia herrerae]